MDRGSRLPDNEAAMETMPSSSSFGVELASGPTSALAANAALTLVREEMAHALAATAAFFRLLVNELREHRHVSRDYIDIAVEEVERLQVLVTSLRETPGLHVAPKATPLAALVRAAARDLEKTLPRSAVALTVDVPGSVIVSLDATALGFVVHAVVAALKARGISSITLSASPPEASAVTCTLYFIPDPCESLASSLMPCRAWAGSDEAAIMFAVARRVSRASNMLLHPPVESSFEVRLEIPLSGT